MPSVFLNNDICNSSANSGNVTNDKVHSIRDESNAYMSLILKDILYKKDSSEHTRTSCLEDYHNKENISPLIDCDDANSQTTHDYVNLTDKVISSFGSVFNSSADSYSGISRSNSFLESSLIGKLCIGWQDEPDFVSLFLSGQLHKIKDKNASNLYLDDHKSMFIPPCFEMKPSFLLNKNSNDKNFCLKHIACSCTEKNTKGGKLGCRGTEDCPNIPCSLDVSELKKMVEQFNEDVQALQENLTDTRYDPINAFAGAADNLQSLAGTPDSTECEQFDELSEGPVVFEQAHQSRTKCNLFSMTIISAPQEVDSSTRFPSSFPLAAASSTICPASAPITAASHEGSSPPGLSFQTASTPSKTQPSDPEKYTFKTPSQSALIQDFYNTPCQSKQKVTTELSSRFNPFDSCAEILQLPTVSPSLFKDVLSPSTAKDNEGNFDWSIEQIAMLNPASIEVPSEHLETPHDAEFEKKAQEAIDNFFSRRCLLPSPWTNSAKSKPIDIHCARNNFNSVNSCTPILNPINKCNVFQNSAVKCDPTKVLKSPLQSNNVSCQTDLSLPFNLPAEVMSVLAPYLNPMHGCTPCSVQQSPEYAALAANTSLRRRLMFSTDDASSCSPSLRSSQKSLREVPIRSTLLRTLASPFTSPYDVCSPSSPIVSGVHPSLRNILLNSEDKYARSQDMPQPSSPAVSLRRDSIAFENLSPIVIPNEASQCDIEESSCKRIILKRPQGPLMSWCSPVNGGLSSSSCRDFSPKLSPIKIPHRKESNTFAAEKGFCDSVSKFSPFLERTISSADHDTIVSCLQDSNALPCEKISFNPNEDGKINATSTAFPSPEIFTAHERTPTGTGGLSRVLPEYNENVIFEVTCKYGLDFSKKLPFPLKKDRISEELCTYSHLELHRWSSSPALLPVKDSAHVNVRERYNFCCPEEPMHVSPSKCIGVKEMTTEHELSIQKSSCAVQKNHFSSSPIRASKKLAMDLQDSRVENSIGLIPPLSPILRRRTSSKADSYNIATQNVNPDLVQCDEFCVSEVSSTKTEHKRQRLRRSSKSLPCVSLEKVFEFTRSQLLEPSSSSIRDFRDNSSVPQLASTSFESSVSFPPGHLALSELNSEREFQGMCVDKFKDVELTSPNRLDSPCIDLSMTDHQQDVSLKIKSGLQSDTGMDDGNFSLTFNSNAACSTAINMRHNPHCFLQHSSSVLIDSDVDMIPVVEGCFGEHSSSQDTGYQTGSIDAQSCSASGVSNSNADNFAYTFKVFGGCNGAIANNIVDKASTYSK